MANTTFMTFTRGYITIMARKREDVAKFIYLVNKYLSYLEYYTHIPEFEKIEINEILDNLDKKVSKDYHLELDLNYEGFTAYSFFFNGASKWNFYINIKNLKSDIEKLTAHDDESLKMLEDIIKSGIKIVFDYIEENSATLTISKSINIIDFEKNQEYSEIKSKNYTWISENLREFCSYDEYYNLSVNGQIAFIQHLIKSNKLHKKNLKAQRDSEKLLRDLKNHYNYIYSRFFNTGATVEPKRK